jgi:hypothetical protein
VDNPEYPGWSGFKPGSWVTFEQPCGKNGELLQETDKLVKITREKAVFESTKVENGFKYPVFEKEIGSKLTPKHGPAYSAARHPDAGEVEYEGPGGKTTFIWRRSAQGDEEIDVAGNKLKCRWTKMDYEDKCATPTIPSMNDKWSTKIWSSPEIPGGVARLEIARLIQGNPPEALVVTRVVKGWKKA